MKLAGFFVFSLVFLFFGFELNGQTAGPGIIGWEWHKVHHQPTGTSLTVTDNTADGATVNVIINDVPRGLLHKGMRALYEYGYGSGGDVRVRLEVCSSINETVVPNDIPSWMATDPKLAGVAITPEYLASDPNKKDFEGRVKKIQSKLKDELGGNIRIGELQSWAALIVANGFAPKIVATCESPVLLLGKVSVQQYYPEEYYYPQQARAILLEVRGNRASGYRVVGNGYFPQF